MYRRELGLEFRKNVEEGGGSMQDKGNKDSVRGLWSWEAERQKNRMAPPYA